METIKYILFTIAMPFAMVFALESCSKDDSASEPTSVTKVSSVTNREIPIDKAELTQFVIIQGSGLNHVSAIKVNDVDVNMDDVYATKNEITFSIPRVVPNEVNNLITLQTPQGIVTAPLTINVPSLKVTGMACEWVAPGDTMYINGDYFDLYKVDETNGTLYFGDKVLPIISSKPTSIGFKLPSDAAAGTIIKIKGGVGGLMTVPGQYRYMGFKVQTFDNANNYGWGVNHRTVGNVGGAPAPINGQFARITPTAAQTGWIGEVSICQSGTEDCVNNKFPDDMTANPQNYQLKFEVNTQKPMNSRGVDIMFSQNGYCWAPGRAVTFNTNGKWQTITLELTDVWKTGTPINGVVQIMAQYYGEDTDISMDNIRIVPKVK